MHGNRARRSSRRRSRERGATAVLVALTLLVMGALLALAVNVGHLYSVRQDLQNAADSGALAGALGLDGTSGVLPGAVASGGEFAGYHDADRDQVVASPVELGHWTPPDEACEAGEAATGRTGPRGYQFCRVDGRDEAAARRINAVRVGASRAAGAPGGGAVLLFASGLLGAEPATDVRSEAVALAGGPAEAPCPRVPFVIREECFTGGGAIACGDHLLLGMASTPVNTAGFTIFTPSTPNTSDLCSYLQAPPPDCSGDSAGTDAQVGSQIGTGNGSSIVAASCGKAGKVCQLLKQFQSLRVEVPVVRYAHGNGCKAAYSGSAGIVGFATVDVAQVYCKGDPPPPAGTPCAGFATDQCVAVRYVCPERPVPQPAGGGWFGTPARPRLVR